MVIETTRFGAIEIDPQRIISFPKGLVGFPAAQRFVLLNHKQSKYFQWLQSVDEPTLAFPVIDPNMFFPTYEAIISDEDAKRLGITAAEQAMTRAIVTIRAAIKQVTVNLLAPLVIGLESQLAAQIIMNDDSLSVRQPLPILSAGDSEVNSAA
jgi:flagellar assembly factor FliW